MSAEFFHSGTFEFLKGLDANNTKDWFEAHKTDYQKNVKKPADAFRPVLARELGGLTGHEMASKQFRINRDLRFSKDKTPYNAHIRMAFWPMGAQFEGKDAQPPSFFLSIEAGRIRLGTGCMAFSKPVLGRYLRTLETGRGSEIQDLLDSLGAQGFEVSEPALANVPRGFPKDHPYKDLARHKGLAVWGGIADVRTLEGPEGAGAVSQALKPTVPFWKWLAGLHYKP